MTSYILKVFKNPFDANDRMPFAVEYFCGDPQGMAELFTRVVDLTNNQIKFAIYEVGQCVGDFS